MPLAAFVIGLLMGIPILRTRGLRFAVATLGIGLIVSDVANNCISLTGGPIGGPVVGAAFLSGLPEALSVEPRTKLIIYGAVLLATVVFLPRGLAPEATRRVRRLVGACPAPPKDAVPPAAAAGLHTESQGAVR
jgi:ABC-type branched-subunit amino acid transport system permease subunit